MPFRDPASPEYWRNRALTYTNHARERAQERGIRLLRSLNPEDLRLCDCDMGLEGLRHVTFKVMADAGEPYFVTLSVDAVVITMYYKTDKYDDLYQKKQRIRTYAARIDDYDNSKSGRVKWVSR